MCGELGAKKSDTGINALFFIALGAAVTTAAGLFVEIPVSEILTRQTYDSLSIVQVYFLGVGGGGICLHSIPVAVLRVRAAGRLYVTATAGTAVLLLTYALYPKFFLGPFADVDPYILTDFLPAVQETKPLFGDASLALLRTLMEPVMAALLLAAAFLKSGKLRKSRKMKLLKLTGLLAITFVLTCFQGRWGYYLEPVAIIVCAALLPTISNRLEKDRFCATTLAALFMAGTGLCRDDGGCRSRLCCLQNGTAPPAPSMATACRKAATRSRQGSCQSCSAIKILFFTPSRIRVGRRYFSRLTALSHPTITAKGQD